MTKEEIDIAASLKSRGERLDDELAAKAATLIESLAKEVEQLQDHARNTSGSIVAAANNVRTVAKERDELEQQLTTLKAELKASNNKILCAHEMRLAGNHGLKSYIELDRELTTAQAIEKGQL